MEESRRRKDQEEADCAVTEVAWRLLYTWLTLSDLCQSIDVSPEVIRRVTGALLEGQRVVVQIINMWSLTFYTELGGILPTFTAKCCVYILWYTVQQWVHFFIYSVMFRSRLLVILYVIMLHYTVRWQRLVLTHRYTKYTVWLYCTKVV